MAAWTNIPGSALVAGQFWSDVLAGAAFENPVAMSEGAPDAPIIRAGWHPYNLLTYGGAQTGVIYNHAVDGSVATIVTPDFEDGYEYRLVGEFPSPAGTSSAVLELFQQTDSYYSTGVTFKPSGPTNAYFSRADAEIISPRSVSQVHFVSVNRGLWQGVGDVMSSSSDLAAIGDASAAQKILRARLVFTGALTAGVVRMYRRLDLVL